MKFLSFKIDTVAFDRKSSAFNIIEYKKKKKQNDLIAQGKTYFNHMKRFKSRFLDRCRKAPNAPKFDKVEWEKSKLIFVAPKFTIYQQGAAMGDPSIQLWEVHKYNNGNFN